MGVIAYFLGLACLPIIYNLYNPINKYVPAIPMQNSLLQTTAFMLFMMSVYCAASYYLVVDTTTSLKEVTLEAHLSSSLSSIYMYIFIEYYIPRCLRSTHFPIFSNLYA